MTALERLSRWDRKFYSYTMASDEINYGGPSIGITLKGGNRSVTVCDILDSEGWDGKSDSVVQNDLSLEEMINLAITRWHECLTPRMHVVYFDVFDVYSEGDALPVGVKHYHAKCYTWEGLATGEMNAITIATDLIDSGGKTFVNNVSGVRELYVKQ